MTEPRRAYVVTTSTSSEVKEAGGLGSSVPRRTTYTNMYLSPTDAIKDFLTGFGKFLAEDSKIHIYEINLSELDGVWPRVSSTQFNDYRLKWQSTYFGQIPSPFLTWLNSTTKGIFEQAIREP